MSRCDFCPVCKRKYCPKEGKSKSMPRATITISSSLNKRLTALCIKKSFVKGEEYYKVPDYASAISFLLGKHERKKKNPKSRRRKGG